MNRRPHPYQITDSRFEVRREATGWYVVETWWQIGRDAENEDAEHWHSGHETEAEAIAERDRRMRR